MAELVDALVSGTSGAIRGGSSPLLGTTYPQMVINLTVQGAVRDAPVKPPETDEALPWGTQIRHLLRESQVNILSELLYRQHRFHMLDPRDICEI